MGSVSSISSFMDTQKNRIQKNKNYQTLEKIEGILYQIGQTEPLFTQVDVRYKPQENKDSHILVDNPWGDNSEPQIICIFPQESMYFLNFRFQDMNLYIKVSNRSLSDGFQYRQIPHDCTLQDWNDIQYYLKYN